MSLESDSFHQIKDGIKSIDKNCDFKVDFDKGIMLAYTKSLDKENEIKKVLELLGKTFEPSHTTAVKRFNIKL